MGETLVNKHKTLTELMGENEVQHNSINRVESMRKKTDLSDIILEKENKVQGNKKLILSAASLVLLFLVFLIISKIINSTNTPNETQEKTINTKNEKIIPTEIDNLINKQTNDKENKNNPISKTDIENLNDTDLKFEEMVRKLREEDAKESNSEVVEVITPKEKILPNKPNKKVINKDENTIVKNNIEITKKEVKIKEQTKKPKVIITEVKKPKIVKKPTIVKPKRGIIFGQNSGYYVQVGATTTPNPNRFLAKKIKQNGYSYITHPVIVKGRKFYKVLIGPFSSKTEALNKLPRIKATINPQAFLYHLR
jgi:cell division septation protein DedD